MAEGAATSWRWLAKMHAYVFCVLRSTFKAAWNDGLDEWKALMVISLAMEFAGITIASAISIGLQRRVLLPQSKAEFSAVWGMVGMGLATLNYYTLVFRRKWSQFEKEVKRRPRMSQVYGSVAVWGSLILIVAASEWFGSIAWKLPP